MTYKVTAWVLEHSEATLASRLILLAMAERARDDGGGAYESVKTLAHKSRVGESTARACLRRLEAEGRITPVGKSRFGTVVYRVEMDNAPECRGGPDSEGGQILRGARSEQIGGQNRAKGGPDSGPEPITAKPTTKPSSLRSVVGTRPRSAVKFGGRPVNDESWRLTQAILTEFNRQSGRKYRLVKSSGEPSEAAKRIYGRVRDYPDITEGEFADIIERTLASRWWGGDEPWFGVVFGPKVFEENITRKPHDTRSQQTRRSDLNAKLRKMMEE